MKVLIEIQVNDEYAIDADSMAEAVYEMLMDNLPSEADVTVIGSEIND